MIKSKALKIQINGASHLKTPFSQLEIFAFGIVALKFRLSFSQRA